MDNRVEQNSRRPRVLAVGHGAIASGFARVLDSLIQRLVPKYEFHHFATNHQIEQVPGPWPIYGNADRFDPNGLDRLGELIRQIEPEIVFILSDLWFCCVHAQRLRSMVNRPSLVAYCPVDGILTRPELYSLIGAFDQIVAYTEFGKNQLKRIDEVANIEVIPHGVDCNVFFPMQPNDLLDRAQAKRRLFGDNGAETGFVVLNAAKNDARKRLDLTIEGFARFARNKPPDVKLYLHTGATVDGLDIREMVRRAEIEDRFLSTDGWLQDHPAVDDEYLNLLYNAADVGINTASGEGWGLISFEHAATGAPQIVPEHTACEELWMDVDTTLPIRSEGEHVGLGMLRKFVNPDDIALVLEKLYSDRVFREEQARRAYNNARQPAYNWDQIAAQWDDLFQRILATRRH